MTRKIYSGASNFIPKGVTKTLHTGPGKLRAIVATNEIPGTPAVLALYDNPAASGDLLIAVYVGEQPIQLFYPLETPLVFASGLTVVTGASIRAHIISEA